MDEEKTAVALTDEPEPIEDNYATHEEWYLAHQEWLKIHPRSEEQTSEPQTEEQAEEPASEETPKELRIDAEILPVFSYPEYHADGLWRAGRSLPVTPFSLIQKIEVINTTGETKPGLAISFVFDNDAFAIDDIVLPPCPSPAGEIRLPWIKVKKPLIDQNLSTVPCELSINLVSTEDNSILSSSTHNFNLIPISQTTVDFIKERKLFAKYVTPLAPTVKQLANKAVVHNDGKPIVSYQNHSTEDFMLELKAVYETLHDENILYQNPASGESLFQRVRLPEEVLRDKKATCLDSSILYCSLLMELGFHPVLVFIDGHAFVGVFLKERDEFSGGLAEKVSDITNRMGKNDQTMVLIESTCITSGNTASFQDALDAGSAHLKLYEGRIFAAVDIDWCHSGTIFTPIPIEGNDFELENYIKQKEIEDRDLNPIVNREFTNVEEQFRMDRFKAWERKLLDLSEKNRLVRFRTDSRSCIRIMGKNVPDVIANNDSVNLAVVMASQVDIVAAFMQREDAAFDEYLRQLDDGSLLAFGFEPTLKSLMRKAKTALEETGASPLYLSLGLVSFQSPKSHQRIHAPFVLLPIHIKRESGGKRFTMSYDLGDVKINETVFEFIKLTNPDLNFNSIYNFDDLTKYADLCHTFKEISGEDIVVEEDFFFISNLSFAHQVMWLDMVKRKDELAKNIVVRSIVDNQSHLTEQVIPDDKAVEQLERYEDFAAPLYYDSSQLKAILDCGAGKSFILDGPPGTGKSQTIVNMIANAFYNGKKVLFVAEKKAALDVVADRLSKLGLGNYCLELHSNKATKGDFFAKLGVVMDLGPTKSPEEYHEQCAALTNKKNELRAIINKMHGTDECYMSLYDSIVATKQLDYLSPNRVPLSSDFVRSYDEEKNRRVTQLIDSYISFAKGIRHFESNPIKAFGITQINFFTDRERVPAELRSAADAIESYLAEVKRFVKTLPMQFGGSDDLLDKIFQAFDFVYERDIFTESLYDFYNAQADINAALARMEEMAAKRAKILETFDIDSFFSSVNLDEAAHIFREGQGLFKKPKMYKILKEMFQPFFKSQILNEQIGGIILQATEYRKWKADLSNDTSKFTKLTGLDAYESLDSIDSIRAKLKETMDFINLVFELAKSGEARGIANYFFDLARTKDPITKMEYDSIRASRTKYLETERLIKEKYAIDEGALKVGDDYYDNLLRMLRLAAEPQNFDDLAAMASLNKVANGFRQEGLYGLVEKVILGQTTSEEMPELLRISLAYGCLSIYFADEDINAFSPSFFNDEIVRYKEAIRQYSETTVASIAARISESFARNNIQYGASGAIGRLKKSIANSGRGVSIRGTLSEFGDVILRYFPCFLMSPLSAAQYLAVDSERGKAFSKFDIVIFDEASQIPTHEAIGPIARGNSLIVAGDPKQMPPSPYFSAGLSLSDDDDGEEDSDITKYTDSPSLLDECISIEMPRHRLSYHYRSKHESLIQFSNENFYGNGLYTFPSSSTATSCVEFRFVETKTPKKDSSLSKEELDAILNAFTDIYHDPKNATKSLGIICFNIKQADKITDSINAMLDSNKELAAAVEGAVEKSREPWFVKSIENVQGDERDIIILSVGFALSKSGYPTIRGPLVAGDNNGERRLNVAASRSKERMIVISTIKASQFQDDSQIKNPGAKCLKHFLKYAEDSSFASSHVSSLDDSSILYYIKNDLEDRGYVVDANVGNSEFRVDLAVRKKGSDHYDLGILVDTRPIVDDISCRDKFYVQESVLNMMKWKTVNIYTLEYYKYPSQTIDRIIEAMNAEYQEQDTHLDIKIESQDNDFDSGENPYDAQDYVIPRLYPMSYDNDSGYDSSLKPTLEEIISALSPIAYSSIKKIIGDLCGFRSFSGDREEHLKRKLNQWFGRENRQYGIDQYFYWADSSREVTEFRKAGPRDIDEIAVEEIAVAMKKVQTVQGGLSENELYRVLMRAFEFPTTAVTQKYREYFKRGYDLAKRKGWI